jgi:hypothetical protein
LSSSRKSSVTVSNRCLTTEASAQFYEIWEIKKGQISWRMSSKS